MRQAPLPEPYVHLGEEETADRIEAAKAKLGPRLVILGHHYQRDEIIRHAHFRGDSYKLAKDGAQMTEADFIVFCGVHFMAESADILTPERQAVILPNLAAGCSMADMANHFQVRSAWRQIAEATDIGKVVPVTYINSAAAIKAFVGEHGGTVCTSTNAAAALEWAFTQGEKVIFFPDQHLGRNTGVKMGFDPERDMVVWDPFKRLGGNSLEDIQRARFILWKGHCSVHSRFTVAQIEAARAAHPGVRVIVHPECELAVVQASDLDGSTERIIQAIEAAEPGSAWAVGTEINLVSRLAQENPDKTIFCLDPQICPCSTMYRIHPSFLLWCLEELAEGRVMNQVRVPAEIAAFSRIALQRMLDIGTERAAKAG
jgi:quinolinate synthase